MKWIRHDEHKNVIVLDGAKELIQIEAIFDFVKITLFYKATILTAYEAGNAHYEETSRNLSRLKLVMEGMANANN